MLRYGFSLWISTAAGGASRDRTDDPLLAKQVLSQQSYGPVLLVGLGRVELPTSPLSGVRSNQLSYRPAAGTPENQTICVSAHAPYRLLFSRKEVIQPQVPLRLPCYDFTPVIDHTVVGALLAVRLPASGTANSHGVTGGVYKARERIHRGVLIRDYKRFRLHGVELQTPIRTTTGFLGLAPPRGLATLCTGHCSTCVALPIRAMMT